MNYKNSKKLFEIIRSSKKIAITSHINPDVDAVASCLSLFNILREQGFDVDVLYPDKISKDLAFLPGTEKVKKMEFEQLSTYDLFIVCDLSNWNRVFEDSTMPEKLPYTVLIDHHSNSKIVPDLGIVEEKASSTCEVLYLIFEDWGLNLNKVAAEILLSGIVSDTGGFQYDKTSKTTFRIASEILDLGVDYINIIQELFRSYNQDTLRFWGELLVNINVDSDHRFSWVALRKDAVKKYKDIGDAKSLAANMFIRGLKDTDFGMVIIQRDDDRLSVSFRERTGFNILPIAEILGGGGHKSSAGATLKGFGFDEGVEHILSTAREEVKNQYEKNK